MMKSNKDFLVEKWISLFCGSYGSPLLGAPLGGILVLGDVVVTSYGMKIVC